MLNNIKTMPTKDFEEVVGTVAKYVKGLQVDSVADLAQSFHQDALSMASRMASCSAARSGTSMTLSRKTALR